MSTDAKLTGSRTDISSDHLRRNCLRQFGDSCQHAVAHTIDRTYSEPGGAHSAPDPTFNRGAPGHQTVAAHRLGRAATVPATTGAALLTIQAEFVVVGRAALGMF